MEKIVPIFPSSQPNYSESKIKKGDKSMLESTELQIQTGKKKTQTKAMTPSKILKHHPQRSIIFPFGNQK